MPKIPRIVNANSPGVPSQPQVSMAIAQAPGEAAAKLGEAVTNVGQEFANKQIENRRTKQVMESSTSAALDANQFIDTQLKDPDYATFPHRVQAGLKEIQKQYSDQLKDPQANLAFTESFDRLTADQVIKARAEAGKRENDADAASLLDSLDKLKVLASTQTGQGMDGALAEATSAIQRTVNGGIITAESGQKLLHKFTQDVSDAKWMQQIRENPHQAFTDLSATQNDPHLDPVKRELFLDQAKKQADAQDQQDMTNLLEAQKQAEKLANEHRQAAVSTMTSQALQGQLTHPALEDQRSKLNLSREDYEHLFDLIDKKPNQPASDPATLAAMTLAVRSSVPTVNKTDLADKYRAGKLNLEDYTKLDSELTSNLRYNAEQAKSDLHYREQRAQTIVGDALKSDPATASAAMQELVAKSRATGGTTDPLLLAPDIIKKYQPVIDALGGQTQAAVQGQFNSARQSYIGTLQSQRKWSSDHFIKGNIGFSNPYDSDVQGKKDDLLNKAKTAGKLLGPAPVGALDGTAYLQKSTGKHLIAVGGQLIAE